MGIGFPSRLKRSDFGPQLRNTYPVENPETDVPDVALNAAFWQTAGANLIVPRAVLIAEWTGAAFTVLHQAEAWNPNLDQAHPVLARDGAGDYNYTFAADYLNEEGEEIPTVLIAARASPVAEVTGGTIARFGDAWVDGTNPLKIVFRLYDLTSTLRDARFWLEVM